MRNSWLAALTAAILTAGAWTSVAGPASAQLPPGAPSSGLHPFIADTGGEAGNPAEEWYFNQRSAPGTSIAADAYASLAQQAATLPVTAGTWSEFTTGHYFTDSAAYHDPVFPADAPATTTSNSGSGDRFVSGRVTALATAADHTLFAGVSSGGVWRSRNNGATWQPITDKAATLSVGALAVDNQSGRPFTVYVGTGEANFADSYAGVGVLVSTDGGDHFSRLGGSELNGALTFRIVIDPRNHRLLYAATSHGLYRFLVGSDHHWTRILSFDRQYTNGTTIPINERVWDAISDVLVLPSRMGAPSRVVAVAGWLGGAPTNGLYQSDDGGSHFRALGGFGTSLTGVKLGRVSLAASAHGDHLYAVAQSTDFSFPNGSILGGVFSSTGGAGGPWRLIATSPRLAQSGSALAPENVKIAYQPGVQATYNQFITVDPTDSGHVYLGLEEVFETRDAGSHWNAIAPYWNFSLPSHCFAYQPFEGSCNHYQAHADQHAVLLSDGTIYIGNDGGVYRKPMTDHAAGNWQDLNRTLRTLLFYSATSGASAESGRPLTVFGGMQDNGTGKFFARPTPVASDTDTPILVDGVQPFGGDGGYTVVDPHNPNNVITEYTNLASQRTNDGGHTWTSNAPPDPGALFIAPIVLDQTRPTHLVAAGAYLWDSTAGFATSSADWKKVYDFTAGGTLARVGTAAATTTASNGVSTTWAGWCGPCDGADFASGIVVLSNAGGAWHQTQSYNSATGDYPPRYVTGFAIDSHTPASAYFSLSGFSSTFTVGPRDPGVGHVFRVANGTIANRSANLIDAPADAILTVGSTVIAGTDFGVYASFDAGRHWSRLGSNLPNVPVLQLSRAPNGSILAATHGRGVWTIRLPGD